jgi:hypothetical protein
MPEEPQEQKKKKKGERGKFEGTMVDGVYGSMDGDGVRGDESSKVWV